MGLGVKVKVGACTALGVTWRFIRYGWIARAGGKKIRPPGMTLSFVSFVASGQNYCGGC